MRFTKKEGSEKGAFTYDYFNLAGLKREILDEAQGAPIVEEPSEAGYESGGSPTTLASKIVPMAAKQN